MIRRWIRCLWFVCIGYKLLLVMFSKCCIFYNVPSALLGCPPCFSNVNSHRLDHLGHCLKLWAHLFNTFCHHDSLKMTFAKQTMSSTCVLNLSLWWAELHCFLDTFHLQADVTVKLSHSSNTKQMNNNSFVILVFCHCAGHSFYVEVCLIKEQLSGRKIPSWFEGGRQWWYKIANLCSGD